MRYFLTSLIMLSCLSSFYTVASVELTLGKDVEALIVNGEMLPLTLGKKSQFSLPNGSNQLVVRVSKLVEAKAGANFEKFKTDPLVLTFNASNTKVTITPSKIIKNIAHVNDFKKAPSFKLVTSNAQVLQAKQDVLPKGAGLIRIYENELARYNAKIGYSQNNLPTQKPVVMSEKAIKVSKENALILLQADFLRLSESNKKAFLQWATKNTNE